MSFVILLIIFALVLFVVATLLLLLANEVKIKESEMPRTKRVFFILSAFLSVFLLLSIYCAISGQRIIIWFFFFVLVGILSLYLAIFSYNFSKFSLTFIIFLAVLQSLMPIVQNRGIIFGPDQWRDLKVTLYIVEKGTFEGYPWMSLGFYSVIPLFNILNAMISETLGLSAMVTIGAIHIFFCLLSILSIYAAAKKLTNNSIISLLAIMVFLSTPRLAIVQAVPSTASISLGLLLFFLFIRGRIFSSKRIIIVSALIALTIAILHPLGIFLILVSSFAALLLNNVYFKEKLDTRSVAFTKGLLAVCLVIPLAYWSLTEEVFAGVFNPLIKFIHTIIRFEKVPSIYQPQYQSPGFEAFSFAWALPVAFSAAYILTTSLMSRGKMYRLNRVTFGQILDVCAFGGVLLVLSAFISVLFNPGASIERYINVIAYSLLIFPSSFVFSKFLFSRKKIVIFLGIILLIISLAIGSSSPDWAPFENPSFGAVRYTYTSFSEANIIVNFLPSNSYLYEDHDIPISGVGSLKNINLSTSRSYQLTRAVVQSFKDNHFTPFDPSYQNALIVIKKDEVNDQNLFYNYVNLIYDSDRHIIVDPLP